MGFSGFFFISWRIFEVIITIPIVGMLAWVVHTYVKANLLTPDYVLVMFIVSVLALAWTLFTLLSYLRARHDAIFVGLVDLAFLGSFIAGVVLLRGWGGANCGNIDAGITSNGFYIFSDENKHCAVLKASFALGIIDIIAFFVTFIMALFVARNHRDDDRVVVKHEYRSTRHGSHSSRRPPSREYRSSRDRQRSAQRSRYSTSRSRTYV